jgi:hypothetical protein
LNKQTSVFLSFLNPTKISPSNVKKEWPKNTTRATLSLAGWPDWSNLGQFIRFYLWAISIFFTEKVLLLNLSKYCLGYVLGDFFTPGT